jgi:RNA polymerase sigma-70 factor (ECF subfamily)
MLTSKSEQLKEQESVLVNECMEGNRVAQSKLYGLFAPKMMAICCRYSKNRMEAEDVLVEGFMKVFDHLHQFRKEGSLEGWIRRIMVNLAIEKFRKKPGIFPGLRVEGGLERTIDSSNVLNDMSARELLGLIQVLPPACQMVFNLYTFEGMKHKEIAEKLGIAEGTSKSNLSDAKNMLRKAIVHSQKEASIVVNIG